MRQVLKAILLVLFFLMPAGQVSANSEAVAQNVSASVNSGSSDTSLITTSAKRIKSREPLLLVFVLAVLAGLLTVFTPYVYAFIPITISHLTFRSNTPGEGVKSTILFTVFVVAIFTTLGFIAVAADNTTGFRKLSSHWIFNLFFFRLLAGLGLSLLGAFEISLPVSIIRATHSKAISGTVAGMFFMALTLPVVTFPSTGPMVGLVLVQAAKGGLFGPVTGMLGFSMGLCVPFIYPRMINIMPISVLNYIKVLLGFAALLLGLKFLSRADVAGGWHIIDRDVFIIIWILLSVIQGAYMMGWIRLSNDYVPAQNIYGQTYVSLLRLFLAIASFTVAIYLLPGLWGAPLRGVSPFLPTYAL